MLPPWFLVNRRDASNLRENFPRNADFAHKKSATFSGRSGWTR